MTHNRCKYCGYRIPVNDGPDACFRCWELFEEGDADPVNHPRATEIEEV